MTAYADRVKSELQQLIERGYKVYYGLAYQYVDEKAKKEIGQERLDFTREYEKWYSEARQVLKFLLPDRLKDFDAYYKNEKRKSVSFATYTISDALVGLTTRRGGEALCDPKSAIPRMHGQLQILESCENAIDGILFNLRSVMQADLFESELEQARVLNKNGFHRAAGALAGVVLEGHLKDIAMKKNVSPSKKNPSISDFNESLKNADLIEIKDWRFIQHLADIRNLCDHKKTREPERNEIDDLIAGVDKVIKIVGQERPTRRCS